MRLIAKRYAKGLLKSVGEEGVSPDEVLASLDELKKLFAVSRFEKLLKSPVIPRDLKRAMLVNSLEHASAPAFLFNFVDVLLAAQRIALLPMIIDDFAALCAEAKGEQHAEIRSAIALPAAQLTRVAEELSDVFHKKIILKNKVDQRLLGGFIVQVGHQVIDQSVTSRIRALTLDLQSA